MPDLSKILTDTISESESVTKALPGASKTRDVPAFQTFTIGESITVRKKLVDNFNQTEAQTQNVENELEYSISRADVLDGIVSGLVVTTNSGLTYNISAGIAICGYWFATPAFVNQGPLTDNTTNYIYLLQDGTITFNVTGTSPASQRSILIASVVTSGNVIITINNYAKGVKRGVGQSVYKNFICTTAELVGDAVYISAADTVSQAVSDGDYPAKSYVVGVIAAKDSDTSCWVAVTGAIVGGYTGLTIGDRYFLQANVGMLGTGKPSVPDPAVCVAIAVNTTQILIAVNVDESSISGGSGAPADASIVTINAESGLSNETQHVNILLADRHPGVSHNHQSNGDQGSKLDHGNALTGLGDDDHSIYLKKGGDTITGDILLGVGVLIGGVDIPTHAVATGGGAHGATGGKKLALKPNGSLNQLIFDPNATRTPGQSAVILGDSEFVADQKHEHTLGTGQISQTDKDAALGSVPLLEASFEGADCIATTGDRVWLATQSGNGLVPDRDNTNTKHGAFAVRLRIPSLSAGTDYSELDYDPISFGQHTRINPDTVYTYNWEFWAISSAGTETLNVWISCYDKSDTPLGNRTLKADTTVPNSWTRYYGTLNGEGAGATQFPIGTVYFQILFRMTETGGVGSVWVDDVQIYRLPILPYISKEIAVLVGGVLTASTSVPKPGYVILQSDLIIEAIEAHVETAPTGADIKIDIHKIATASKGSDETGTTIYTTQGNRPTITAGGYYVNATLPDVISLSAGDVLRFYVDQIGSTVAGSDLTINIHVKQQVT
jgi:hypothetical protein